MVVNSDGIRIGDGEGRIKDPSNIDLILLSRHVNENQPYTGIRSELYNSGNGNLYGYSLLIDFAEGSLGGCTGYYADVRADGQYRIGYQTVTRAKTGGLTTGYSYGGIFSAKYGEESYGVYAEALYATNLYGIYATCGSTTGNYGGYFEGNVHATGAITSGTSVYKIDHPQDPENMYLEHSLVGSNEMKNVYDGIITLDSKGEATVELPTYVEALNGNFRYQLTPIGASMPDLFIASEVHNGEFIISGGQPNMKVSWQITGVRKDALANSMSNQVEVMKSEEERGLYQNPEAYGFGIEQSVDYRHHLAADNAQEAEK